MRAFLNNLPKTPRKVLDGNVGIHTMNVCGPVGSAATVTANCVVFTERAKCSRFAAWTSCLDSVGERTQFIGLFLFTSLFSGEPDMLKRLWLDEGGAILSLELVLIMVIVVIGISVGMVVLRDATVACYQRLASVIDSIDPGVGWSDLEYTGAVGPQAYVAGTWADAGTLSWDVGAGQMTANEVVANALGGVTPINPSVCYYHLLSRAKERGSELFS